MALSFSPPLLSPPASSLRGSRFKIEDEQCNNGGNSLVNAQRVSPIIALLVLNSTRGNQIVQLHFSTPVMSFDLSFLSTCISSCAYASCIARTQDKLSLSKTWGSIHDVTMQHVPEQHLILGLGPREECHFRCVLAWGWIIATV